MPVTAPAPIRPYLFHGVNLDWQGRPKDGQAEGDCPFCGKEGKFYVGMSDRDDKHFAGGWKCMVCGRTGNQYTFLQALLTKSLESVDAEEATSLATNRGLLSPKTLSHWGICRSSTTGDWLIPGYNHEGKLQQLYKYLRNAKENRMYLCPTPGLKHQLHGVNLFSSEKDRVYICEGLWDGVVLWEALGKFCRSISGKVVQAPSERSALLTKCNVLAVPSCSVFYDSWAPLFSGKNVCLLYDNDHPNGNGLAAGLAGMERAARIISAAGAESVSCIRWGELWYNLELPSGYDIRDALGHKSLPERAEGLHSILSMIEKAPDQWLSGPSGVAGPVTCESWDALETFWVDAMNWSYGLKKTLASMLACVVSTGTPGEQLWLRVLGPASSGKSTLCEALSTNKNWIVAKSVIRGFFSGFASGDGEDNSLVPIVMGKTLITKDGDTMLQSPNLAQVLSEGRDLYDSASRSYYRNKMGRDYEGVRLTWILCGTASLRVINSSELGERFIDSIIMDRIDDDAEDAILTMVAEQASDEVGSGGVGAYNEKTIKAMAMTGGYVEYLRNHSHELLSEVKMSQDALARCVELGKFIAYMRARPPKKHDECAERELAARLVKQMVKLAKSLAAVLGRKEVDDEAIGMVNNIALDTCYGTVLELAGYLYDSAGTTIPGLAVLTGRKDVQVAEIIRFLKNIGAVEHFVSSPTIIGVAPKRRWRLTNRLRALYASVTDVANGA